MLELANVDLLVGPHGIEVIGVASKDYMTERYGGRASDKWIVSRQDPGDQAAMSFEGYPGRNGPARR